jgi:hypothetical protein
MDNWQEREIQKHYPDAKTVMDLSNGLKSFDGCAFVCPDVLFVKSIPIDRVTFLLYLKSIMHDKSILFVQVLQSDFNYCVKDAGMKLVKMFKEGLYFVYVIQR